MAALFIFSVFIVVRVCLLLIEKQQNKTPSKALSVLYFLVLIFSGCLLLSFMELGSLSFLNLEVTGLSNIVATIVIIYLGILGGRFNPHQHNK